MPPAGVPILAEHPAFAVLEGERSHAISELRHSYGVTEARLEALMITNKLYELQSTFLAELLAEAKERSVDADLARFLSWSAAWLKNGLPDYEERVEDQNSLVARTEPAVAQRVADERATPRAQAIVSRAEAVETIP